MWRNRAEESGTERNTEETTLMESIIFPNKNNLTSLSNISNVALEKNILNLSVANNNNNINKFIILNDESEEEIVLCKKNLECDIYISALKQKLNIAKKERKISELTLNTMKRKILELKEKEIETWKQYKEFQSIIQKIIYNKSKKKQKNNNKKSIRKSPNSSIEFSNYSVLTNLNNKSSYIYYNANGNIYKSPNINMEKAKNKNKLDRNQMNESSKNLYKPINTCPFSLKKNKKHYFQNLELRLNKCKGNNKNERRSPEIQIKKNLMKKLEEDERERQQIQEEIAKIEKEQINLFKNFNQNVKSQ